MSQRTERVAHQLLKEIGRILYEDLQNPHIGFVTLLRVVVSKDLRSAKVFYSVLGSDEEKKKTDINVRNSTKYIKRLVNEKMRLRYAVDLKFIRETSIDESFRIQEILDQIKADEKNREAPEGSDSDGRDSAD